MDRTIDKIEIILAQDEDGGFFQHMKINAADASAYDLLAAFERFCAEKTASCYGCVGCCQERVPVTSLDAQRLMPLLPPAERGLEHALSAYLDIEILPGGAVDIRLKRNADGSCLFMDAEKGCCSVHAYRTFACASHYCLPRSGEIEALRSAVINTGMDELARQLAAAGLLGEVSPADYPPNAFTGKSGYEEILLSSLPRY